jgi:hypothetical protein
MKHNDLKGPSEQLLGIAVNSATYFGKAAAFAQNRSREAPSTLQNVEIYGMVT